MTRVVVLGDVMADVHVTASGPVSWGSDTESSVQVLDGGSAANVATWLADAGSPVSYIGRVGDDSLGRSAVRALETVGVDARVVVDDVEPTGTCVVVVTPDGERTMFPSAGANARVAVADLPTDLWSAGSHLHLVGYALLRPRVQETGLVALRRALDAGMTVSVDPSSTGPLRAAGPTRFLHWTSGVGTLIANVDEARVLAREDDVDAAAESLTAHYAEVVVKLGASGAMWAAPGAHVVRRAASVVPVVDTTGAGDAFAAGWLAARLSGASVEAALDAGCRLGARAVQSPGARPRP